MHNGEILSIAVIIIKDMSSLSEAEFGNLFSNAREGEVTHTTL